MARPAVVVALPSDESTPVCEELRDAGFEAIAVGGSAQLGAVLDERRDIAVAVLDAERDMAASHRAYALLHDGGRDIPALLIASPRALDGLAELASIDDEIFTRPYATEALRWRVEAMCIRSATVDDGSGPVIQTGSMSFDDWSRRGTIVAVFNPKGGVGKTTIATNLASALVLHQRQSVLLVDADTVTGHVMTSLGLDQGRTVSDSWTDHADGGPEETLAEIASAHTSGLSVVALTASPLDVERLEPERVAVAIEASRPHYDVIVVDLHPSYSPINLEVFDLADRILVPVTPDVPALRAAVQLREVADQLDLRRKLAMIVNRANSGVSVADMERTVGMPAMALIRSGGLLLVRAANVGRTVIDMYPRERITEDFSVLAERVMGRPAAEVESKAPRASLRLFGRSKEPVRVAP
jgi:pilus assembly protein CpaE